MIIKDRVKELVNQAVADTGFGTVDFQVEKPKSDFGDYAVNAVFGLAKKLKKTPGEVARQLAEKISQSLPEEIEQVEAVGGYINFFLSRQYLQSALSDIASQKNYGRSEELKGQTVMVEYTDPNPFKLFHIGHLMSNAIGEAIARLYEAQGAKVIRANYQGDIGLHVAKAIWGTQGQLPGESVGLAEKVKFLGAAYARGAAAYENQPETKSAIEEINEKIFNRSDPEVNRLYQIGRRWSLEYFEIIYAKLGTKFDRYFFESETASDGLTIVRQHPDVFRESAGAIIFPGEQYGLHNRVFINARGLPTYETKELGLNKKKFELYPELAQSLIITGNEINEYFRVLLKTMALTIPEAAAKTRHIGHGMLRLPGGKLSSRTGEVVTAEELIEQVVGKLREIVSPKSGLSEWERETTYEPLAISAIKYSILKQSPGHDIIFDFDKSLSIRGDSGPYLQYTYARLNSILTKAGEAAPSSNFAPDQLKEESELKLIKQLFELPNVISESCQKIAPQHLVLYLFELANLANNFYEKIHIIGDENTERLTARLVLVKTTAQMLKSGLTLLGIGALEKI
ncbi:MAG: arginine--tRNA ligase [Patescibacteria group bacterium]